MATREKGTSIKLSSKHFVHSYSLFEKDPTAEVLFQFKPKRDLDPRKNTPGDCSSFLDLTPGQDVRVNIRVTRTLPNRDFMYGEVLPSPLVPGRGPGEEREQGYFPCTYVLPRSIPRIALADLKLETFLGDGGFGQVFKHSYKGRYVAVKEIKTRRVSLDLLKEVNQEATILAKLSYLGCPDTHDTHHVNLCQLIGVLVDVSDLRYSLVLEYCAGGELYHLLHTDKVVLDSYSLVLNFCLQIAEGLEYMHSALEVPIIHRDLKTKNVLLLREVVPSDPMSLEGNTLKLIDFGLARELAKTHLTTDKGTYVYMAPEAIRYNRHSVQSDVWSLGVLFWELLVQVFPYPNIPEFMVLLGVAQGTVALPLPDTFPAPFKNILTKCLTKDCEKRWDIKVIVGELKRLQKQNHSDPFSSMEFQASRVRWQRDAEHTQVNPENIVEEGLGRDSTVSRMSFRAISSSSTGPSTKGSAVITQRQLDILELKASLPMGYKEKDFESEISKKQSEILEMRNNQFQFVSAANVVLAVQKLKKVSGLNAVPSTGASSDTDAKILTDAMPSDLKAIKREITIVPEETTHVPLTNGTETTSADQDLTNETKPADQELTNETTSTDQGQSIRPKYDSIPREEMDYLEQQFKLRRLEQELERTKQIVADSQKKLADLRRRRRFNFFGRKRDATFDAPENSTEPELVEAASEVAAKKRSGTFSIFGMIRSKLSQTKKQAPTVTSIDPVINEDLGQSAELNFSRIDSGSNLCPPPRESATRSAPATPEGEERDLLPLIAQVIKSSSSDHDLSAP